MAKATWSGSITCGLVSCPVKLFTARDDLRVKLNQINGETGNRVRMKRVDEQTGKEVAYEDVVKGYQISPERYVILSEDELLKAEPKKTKEIAILQFCKQDEIPSLAYDNAYYLGPNTGGAKAYQLLAQTMQEAGVVAIGRMVMRTVEYLVCVHVLDDGTLAASTLRFAEEIRSHDAKTLGIEEIEVSDAELEMAGRLVEAMTSELDYSSMHDEHRVRVMELIETKAAGLPPAEEPEQEEESPADLLAALEGSLKEVTGETKKRSTRRKATAKAA